MKRLGRQPEQSAVAEKNLLIARLDHLARNDELVAKLEH